MQILIELTATNDTIYHSSKEAKRGWEYFRLTELLYKLERDGYRINSLYGRFVFNESNKEVIDCGEPGQIYPASLGCAISIFKTGGKLAIIFTDKKYIVFSNRYFVAIHFCHMRKVRPISIYDVLENYDELINNESKQLLDELYLHKFEQVFGKDADARSYFVGDNRLRTQGYAIPGPVLDNQTYDNYSGKEFKNND